jgi:hypothetical protein
MSAVDVHTVWAQLEATRRAIATARHMLEIAHPDAVTAWSERLEHAEAREQELLRQLSET